MAMLNRLSSLRCGHRTHVSIANGFDGRGNSLGHQSAMYPPAMSTLLAQTFATAIFDRRNSEMQTVVAPAVRVDMPSDGLPTPVPAPRAPHVIMKQMQSPSHNDSESDSPSESQSRSDGASDGDGDGGSQSHSDGGSESHSHSDGGSESDSHSE